MLDYKMIKVYKIIHLLIQYSIFTHRISIYLLFHWKTSYSNDNYKYWISFIQKLVQKTRYKAAYIVFIIVFILYQFVICYFESWQNLKSYITKFRRERLLFNCFPGLTPFHDACLSAAFTVHVCANSVVPSWTYSVFHQLLYECLIP